MVSAACAKQGFALNVALLHRVIDPTALNHACSALLAALTELVAEANALVTDEHLARLFLSTNASFEAAQGVSPLRRRSRRLTTALETIND